jgi:TolB-like protein
VATPLEPRDFSYWLVNFTVIQRFGRFSIDPDRLELNEDGNPILVEPQVFTLLAFLIENRGRVLSKDEIIEHVWQGRIVSDDTLNSRISAVRRAVGDNGANQAIIKTFPRRGFRFVAEISGEDGETASKFEQLSEKQLPLPDKPSIAVLPLENMSGDPEQDFLAAGIAEDIITALSRLRWLFVIARNSTFAYKGTSPNIREVARDLGVRYVLEGSVRRAGSRLRVTGQLIDATTGNHIWAERYDRDIEGIFELQDEIAMAIVRAVDPEIQSAEQDRALRKRPENFTAWDHYQRGLWHLFRPTRESLDRAREHFSASIAADPSFAPAWAVKAFTVFCYVNFGWTDSPDDTLAEAQRLAEEAISLDNKEPFGHFAFGRVLLVRREFSSAISQLEYALEINPNFAFAYYSLGIAYLASGHVEKSLPYFDEAIRQSPRDPAIYIYHEVKAVALAHLNRYEEALDCCAKATRHQKGHWLPAVIYASVLGQLGHIDEAGKHLSVATSKEPNLTASNALPATLDVMFEEGREKFMDGLRKAGLRD